MKPTDSIDVPAEGVTSSALMPYRRVQVDRRVLIIAARWIAAMMAAPVIAGIVPFGIIRFVWRSWYDGVGAARSIGGGAAFLSLLIAPMAVGLLVIIAVWRPLKFWTVVGVGAIFGNLPFAFVVCVSVLVELRSGHVSTDIGRHWYGWSGALRGVALGTITGAISSAAFWVMGVWKTDLEQHPLKHAMGPWDSPRRAIVDAPTQATADSAQP